MPPIGRRTIEPSTMTRSRSNGLLEAKLTKKSSQHLGSLQMFQGYIPSTPGVALVVSGDLLDGCGRFLGRSDGHQPFPAGQMIAEPGILLDHRPAARQVGGTSIAEPAVVGLDKPALADAEFAARTGDVLPVTVHRSRDLMGIQHAPAGPPKPLYRQFLAAHRDLHRDAGSVRQVDELLKLHVLVS